MYIYAKDTTPPSNYRGRSGCDFPRRLEETSKPEEASEVLGRLLIGTNVEEITAMLRSIYDKDCHDHTGRISRVSNATALYGAKTSTWYVYQTPRYARCAAEWVATDNASDELEACKCWATQHMGHAVHIKAQGYPRRITANSVAVVTKHKSVVDGTFIHDDSDDTLVYDPIAASKYLCRDARKATRKLAPWEQKQRAVRIFQTAINRICSALAIQVDSANAWDRLFNGAGAPYETEQPETGRTAPRLTDSIRYIADALKYLRQGKAKSPMSVCQALLDTFEPFTLWMAHRAKGNNSNKKEFEAWAELSTSPRMRSILRWAKRIVREDAKAAKAAEETKEEG